jgi:hypothetical protein
LTTSGSAKAIAISPDGVIASAPSWLIVSGVSLALCAIHEPSTPAQARPEASSAAAPSPVGPPSGLLPLPAEPQAGAGRRAVSSKARRR